MTKLTFEGHLSFIENELSIKLLDWQKEVLQKIYENNPYYFRPARGIGITTLNKAMILLEELKKENELCKE